MSSSHHEKIKKEQPETEKDFESVKFDNNSAVNLERRSGGIFSLFRGLQEKFNVKERGATNELGDLEAVKEESRVLFSEKILKNPAAKTLNRLFNLMTLYFILLAPGDMYRSTINQQELEEYRQECESSPKILALSSEETNSDRPDWLSLPSEKPVNPINRWAEIFVETKDIIESAGTKIIKEKELKQEIEGAANYAAAFGNFISEYMTGGKDFSGDNEILPPERLAYFLEQKEKILVTRDKKSWQELLAEEKTEIEKV